MSSVAHATPPSLIRVLAEAAEVAKKAAKKAEIDPKDIKKLPQLGPANTNPSLPGSTSGGLSHLQPSNPLALNNGLAALVGLPPSHPSGLTENTIKLADNFEEYARKAAAASPHLFDPPKTMEPGALVRLDARDPSEILKEDGYFKPNPGKSDYDPESALGAHVNPNSPGSSNLVSASDDFGKNLGLITEEGGFFTPRATLPDAWRDADGTLKNMSDEQKNAWRLYARGGGRVNFSDEMWRWLTEEVHGLGWNRYRYTNGDPVVAVHSKAVEAEAEYITPYFRAGAYQTVTVTAPVDRGNFVYQGIGSFQVSESEWRPLSSFDSPGIPSP